MAGSTRIAPANSVPKRPARPRRSARLGSLDHPAVAKVDGDVRDVTGGGRIGVVEEQVTGLQLADGDGGPDRAWSAATRGMTMPACANDHCTRPEQSNEAGPAAPQTYGRPCRLSAAQRQGRWVSDSPPPRAAAGGRPGRRPAGQLGDSGSTPAPWGSRLIRWPGGQVGGRRADHDRVLAGHAERPGDRVGDHRVDPADAHRAERDHRQPFGCRPVTVTEPPRASLSSLPMV